MSDIDPVILAVFGPAPPGLDLSVSLMTGYDIVSCIVLGLSTASVALRFYVRTKYNTQKENLGIDDYSLLVALLTTAALVGTGIVAGEYGAGKHIWSIKADRFMTLLKIVFAEPWVFAASVTASKVSILLLYRRLFYISDNKMIRTDRVFAIMFWTASTFACAYPIVLWVTMAAACRPLSFFWRQYKGDTDGYCIDVLRFYLILGILNLVNDVIILSVPIPRILKLHINKRKKFSIAGIMLLGSFVCVSSIVRIYYLDLLVTEVDKSWIMGPTFAWSSLEPSVAIISACLPTFAPLFRGLRNKPGATSLNDKAGSGGNSYIRSASYKAPSFCTGQSQFRIEDDNDDEVQLTDMNDIRNQPNVMSRDSSTGSMEFRRNITVKTDVQVITSTV